MLDNKDKKTLLNLAKDTIEASLKGQNTPRIDINDISDSLKTRQSSFVTLTINNDLRGCVGHLVATQELYKNVIENAKAAAFHDHRFKPLTGDEFSQIKIEISILSEPIPVEYNNTDELLDYLELKKPGVIIKKNGLSATYLPQVWEELPEAEDFLSQLCQKAGLNNEDWKESMDIQVYTVEIISQ